MRFITITLMVHAADPITGGQKSTQERFREVLDNARLAEELGFDGFGVGERHERPFISSSPAVVLSHVAALTTRIRLFTAVTTLFSANVTNPIEPYAELFGTLEDFVERSSALIGSPAQVIEKVHRYHEQFGHSVLHLHADAGGLTDAQHRASLELFQSAVAPVLRREIPDPPWGWGGGPIGGPDHAVPAPPVAVTG
jgi:alkanesulfonate monooxygenase SsuD/methylene tetrahydromethanopterin reductase-like flavin-dependent oxidoreductase (luciferase family)